MNLANRSSWICAALFTLAACGGGSSLEGDDNTGGGGGGGGGSAATLALTVQTYSCPAEIAADTIEGCSKVEQITPQTPARVRVALSVSSGTFNVANRPLTVTAGSGQLSPLNITTDADGEAYLELKPGNQLEVNDTITATYNQTVDSQAYNVSGSINVRYVQTVVTELAIDLTTTWDIAKPLSDGSAIPLNASVLIDGEIPESAVTVTFSSRCSQLEPALASVDASAATDSSGTATASYKVTGCTGQDLITATVTAGGKTKSDSITIVVKDEPANSIQFVSAAPQYLCLEGSGCPNSSQLTFKVVDVQGNAKRGATVNFELEFNNGLPASTEGLARITSEATATTDANGLVSATVSSGSLPVSLRVRAITERPGVDENAAPIKIMAVSSQLGVGTGLPNADGFSIAFEKFNIEGGNIDGETTTITARLADHFGNPVPNGTSVTFISPEMGLIGSANQGNCITQSGKCAVTWESSGTRPDDYRITVLAYATGEESFTDVNGNGLYEITDELQREVAEPFVDANENGSYESAGTVREQLIDDNGNGAFDGANGIYDGLLCNSTNEAHCKRRQVQVSGGGVVALSDEIRVAFCKTSACEEFLPSGEVLAPGTVSVCAYAPAPDGKTWNPVAVGTTIAFKAEEPVKILGRSSFVQANTSAAIKIDSGAIAPAQPLSSTNCAAGRQTVVVTGEGPLQVEVTTGKGRYAAASVTLDAAAVQEPSVTTLTLDLTTTWDLDDSLPDGSSIPLSAAVLVDGVAQQNVPVTFSSTCVSAGDASVDGLVNTDAAGIATATYKVNGCAGPDAITATVAKGGKTSSETITLKIKEQPAASIEFVSATKDYLCLEGSGCANSSTLTFKVVDAQGNPKAGASVDLSLLFNSGVDASTPGLAKLSSQTPVITNAGGEVTAVVTAGTLPVSPRVQATTTVTPETGDAFTIAAVSSQLGVGTGLPHSDGFSIAFESFAIAGAQTDGVTSAITARLADHFGNPVPDGTSVTFISPESGLIGGSGGKGNCVTQSGKCSVTWESAGSRPADGRVTVLAYVTGEETFIDRNGNGLYESTDTLLTEAAEPYVDANENDNYDAAGTAKEQLIDDNGNGVFDDADGIYDGMLCNRDEDEAGNCKRRQVQISKSGVIALTRRDDAAVSVAFCSDADCDTLLDPDAEFELANGASKRVYACVYSEAVDGLTWNPAPVGTSIEFSVSDTLALAGTKTFTQLNTSDPIRVLAGATLAPLTLAESQCKSGKRDVLLSRTGAAGLLTVEVTTPDDGIASATLQVVDP